MWEDYNQQQKVEIKSGRKEDLVKLFNEIKRLKYFYARRFLHGL